MEHSITVLRDAFYLFSPIFAPLFALMISFYILPIAFKIAIKKGLVDRPNKRTSHSGKIPNLGGLSIYLGFIFSYLIFCPPNAFPEAQYILLGLTMVVFVGLHDDILITSSRTKLFAELFIIFLVIFFGEFRLTNLHQAFNIGELPYWISFILSVFVFVVIINCINLIDGVDGLASGISLVVSLFYGIYFYLTNEKNLCVMCLALCGAIIPFFIYNVWGKRHKIFMGDTGSLLLGFLISIMSIRFNEMNIVPGEDVRYFMFYAPAISVGVLMVPLFDTFRVFCVRILNKKSPFKPDKNHMHHKLLDLGFSHKQTSFILIGLNVVFIVVSVLLRDFGIFRITLINVAIATVFTLVVNRAIKMEKNSGKDNSNNDAEESATLIDISMEEDCLK